MSLWIETRVVSQRRGGTVRFHWYSRKAFHIARQWLIWRLRVVVREIPGGYDKFPSLSPAASRQSRQRGQSGLWMEPILAAGSIAVNLPNHEPAGMSATIV